jgi:thioredoxin 1
MNTLKNTKVFTRIIDKEPLVLVDVCTEGSGLCKKMRPILEGLKAFIGDKAKILKVDVGRNISAASRYQIAGVPTLILFKNGKKLCGENWVLFQAYVNKNNFSLCMNARHYSDNVNSSPRRSGH